MTHFLRTTRILIGLAVWLLAAAAGGWYLAGRGPESPLQRDWVGQLWNFARASRRTVKLEFPQSFDVRVGDPIFAGSGGEIQQVGEITRVPQPSGQRNAEAVFYATAPVISASCRLTYHQPPDSLEWVLRTMLPTEKRQQIAGELKRAFQENQEEVLRALRPVVEDALRDAWAEAERELPHAIARQREALERLGSSYQREVVEREIVPLVRAEVWPIVRRHAEPVANEVGHEIWQRALLWRFGWRYAYDKSPLPQRGLTQHEWDRFLREEAVPVLEAHTEDFVRVQQQILRDLSADPDVRSAVRRNLGRIVGDPEAQRIVWQVVRETTADNPRFKAVLEAHWTSQRTQAAIQLVAQRLEPTVERIGAVAVRHASRRRHPRIRPRAAEPDSAEGSPLADAGRPRRGNE